MKKNILHIFLFFMVATGVSAQAPYGNEWIDFSKTYYKIKVTQDGIYRIPYSTLSAYLPGISVINLGDFVLYNKGKEVPIYISTTSSFSSSDYIEFYGEKNDGSVDAALYRNSDWQFNPYKSMFSDTNVYYLSVISGAHLRYADVSNNLTSLPAKETYFLHEAKQVYISTFSEGKKYYYSNSEFVSSPAFEAGEGYGDAAFIGGKNYTISTPNLLSISGVDARIKSNIMPSSYAGVRVQFSLNSNLLLDTTNNSVGQINLNKSISSTSLSASNTFNITQVNSVPNSFFNLSFINIQYPRDFNFNSSSTFQFNLSGNGNKQYIEVTNFNTASNPVILYDITNGHRIQATASGSIIPVALPAALGNRKLFLRNQSQFFSVNNFETKSFTDYSQVLNQGDYLIITDGRLFNDGAGNNRVNEYKIYRESTAGGSHKAVVAKVDDLIEQFVYGISNHPLGIKKFIQFAKHTWAIPATHAFLIGKGGTYAETNSGAYSAIKYVRPYGYPPSDVLYAASDTSNIPMISVGRLAVQNATEIAQYLDKVKTYEQEQNTAGDPHQTIAKKEYMKWAIHLGGGTSASQQAQFKSFLQGFENKFRGVKTGGTVYGLYKQNADPVNVITTDYIKNRINKGVSQITFFGHSSTTVFDIGTEEPENYNNVGKYPFFLANGCNAGNMFTNSRSLTERFVLADKKAAIGFLATGTFSLDNSLFVFSDNYYSHLTNLSYNKTYGEIQKNTVSSILSQNTYIPNQTTAMEFVLHGDPLLKPNMYNLPDYVIEPQNVSFNPAVVNTSQDSFSVNLVIYNLGQAINDSISIEVERIVNAQSYFYTIKVPAPLYVDSFSVKIPVLYGTQGVGLNTFNIRIESEKRIPELSETNNDLINQITTFIVADDIYPIYPYEFSIVPNQGVILKASTSDIFAPAKNYVFEIDTTELFNSPIKLSGKVNSKGGVVTYTPNIILKDSTVYYWRVSRDSINAQNGFLWHNTSFLYLKDEYPGWNQSHYFQYLKDNFSSLELPVNRQFKFPDNVKSIEIRTGAFVGKGGTVTDRYDIAWYLNNARQQVFLENAYMNAGVNFIWINGQTGIPVQCWDSASWASYGAYPWGSTIYGRQGFVFGCEGNTPTNHFTPNTPWSQVIGNFLNQIPVGDYVIMYTLNKPTYANWDASLVNNLLSLGASQLTQLVTGFKNAPYIFACRKGVGAFTPIQKIGTGFSGITDTTFSIVGNWKEGDLSSTIIGPAREWGSFHWRYHANDGNTNDKQYVKLYGVSSAGVETFLTNIFSLDTTLQFVSATSYPKIKLVLHTEDVVTRTPTQLDYWRVLYKIAPEAALNPNRFLSVQDSVQEGQGLSVKIAVENVTDIPMDSMQMYYDVVNSANQHFPVYLKEDSLRGLQYITAKLDYNQVQNLTSGTGSVFIEANPLNYNHQVEQYHFNNIAQLRYEVLRDRANPLLDVTFDGIRIMNKDIVSAKPHIVIQLRDENKFLALNDTSLIGVSIKFPDGTVKKYSYKSDGLQFYPASATNLSKENVARVEFDAVLNQDGIYELNVIDADKSGNRSGTESGILKSYDYKVSFEVKQKASISNLLNYPNPFTTRTHFVFRLTGSKVPDFMKIQILTVTGKVIKEIFKEELGSIHIGDNKTEYTWDGTDMYGDKLANGVYFYRVVTSMNDNTAIEHYSMDIDRYFKNGFGKMVLVR